MRDVSARVRSTLPAGLSEKLAEIEGTAKRAVTFCIDALPGGANGSANRDNHSIKLAPHSIDNMSVIGEEIMHLHRWIAGGFPATRPLAGAVSGGYASGLLQVAGHFDECAFFPFLEEIGLNPRAQVGTAMPQTAILLEREIPGIHASGPTDYWRVVLAAIYAQAESIAPHGNDRDSVIRLFERGELIPYARVGQTLSGEIAAARYEGPGAVERRVLRCFHEFLGLPAGVLSVTR